MTALQNLKLTLFTVVRNFKVLPVGLRLGKTQQEITDMTLKTIKEIKKSIDYNAVEELIKENAIIMIMIKRLIKNRMSYLDRVCKTFFKSKK